MTDNWKKGSCHCNRVQFRFRSNFDRVLRCNCSLCHMKGFLHIEIGQNDFELLKGQDDLSHYEFNTKTAEHFFCKVCGVQSFYVPRSDPDGYVVNATCVEGLDVGTLNIVEFDGQNWESSYDDLIGD